MVGEWFFSEGKISWWKKTTIVKLIKSALHTTKFQGKLTRVYGICSYTISSVFEFSEQLVICCNCPNSCTHFNSPKLNVLFYITPTSPLCPSRLGGTLSQ